MIYLLWIFCFVGALNGIIAQFRIDKFETKIDELEWEIKRLYVTL